MINPLAAVAATVGMTPYMHKALPLDCDTFSLTTDEFADLLAGVVEAFTGNDRQTYFKSCIMNNVDNATIVNYFCKASYNFSSYDLP